MITPPLTPVWSEGHIDNEKFYLLVASIVFPESFSASFLGIQVNKRPTQNVFDMIGKSLFVCFPFFCPYLSQALYEPYFRFLQAWPQLYEDSGFLPLLSELFLLQSVVFLVPICQVFFDQKNLALVWFSDCGNLLCPKSKTK